MEGLLLGLDIGTSRTKALLVDEAGREVASSTRQTPFQEKSPGRVEMTTDALRAAVRETVSSLPEELGRVQAVGCAGMAESGVPMDGRGTPLAPIIGWHDPRGEEIVDLLRARFGEALDGRIGRRVRTVSSVAKLGWLVRQGGIGQVRRWLGVPELCLHYLTGAERTDWSLAARTGAFDIAERRYLGEVLDVIGVDRRVFAPVEAAGSAMGRVSAAGAEWLGLAEGIPVTLGGHDHLAGVEGSGARSGDLVNSVGTAETVVARHPTLPDVGRALDLRLAVTLAPDGRGWAVLASGARAGLVLGPAARALGQSLQELDALAEVTGGSVDCRPLVESIERGEDPAVPDAPPGEIWNGILMALAARTDEAVRRLVDLGGPAERLLVFGGGGASRPWLRSKAQHGSLPVWRSTAAQAVARGAALFAGVAAGWWPSAARAPAPELERVAA